MKLFTILTVVAIIAFSIFVGDAFYALCFFAGYGFMSWVIDVLT